MVVMRPGRGFVARAAVAEIVAVEDARFFEQPHGAVNGRDRDAAVDLRCAFIEGLDIGMILRIRDDARDDAALFGDAEALFVAQGFEIDIAGHACLSSRCSLVCLCYKLYRDAPRRGQGWRPCGRSEEPTIATQSTMPHPY